MQQRVFWAGEALLLVYLIACTWTDIRRRQIWCPPAWVLLMLGAPVQVLMGRNLLQWAAGLVPGMILFGLSAVCGQAIGAGDCLVIVASGSILGFAGVSELLFLSFSGAAVWAVLLLVRRRAGRKTQLPFMPFLLAARILMLLG